MEAAKKGELIHVCTKVLLILAEPQGQSEELIKPQQLSEKQQREVIYPSSVCRPQVLSFPGLTIRMEHQCPFTPRAMATWTSLTKEAT